jgi:hypothetical protein
MLRKPEVNNFSRLLSCYSKFQKRRFKDMHTIRCFSAVRHKWTLIQPAVIPQLLVLAIRHIAATDGRRPKRLGNGIQWHNVHTKLRENRPSRLNAAREDTQQLGDKKKIGSGLYKGNSTLV